MLNVILAVVAISLLIIIHELGHLIMAKSVGMRAETFSVGFGPKIWGIQLGETFYQLAAIPLGGYVKVAGESPEEGGGDPEEFWSKTPGQRALFVVGGVVMNFLLAIILFIGAFAIGVPFIAGSLGHIDHGSPAWQAGLKPGDRVLSVNGMESPTFEEISRQIVLGERNEPVALKVRRGDDVVEYKIEPKFDEQRELSRIGISPMVETEITGFHTQRDSDVSPAEQAGIKVGDRIVAVEGVPVGAHHELVNQLLNHPEGSITFTVQRDESTTEIVVEPQAVNTYRKGISGLTPEINALQGGGPAEELGLQAGDVIAIVNGEPVVSAVGFIDTLLESEEDTIEFSVLRGGEDVSYTTSFSTRLERHHFVDSIDFVTSTVVQWVEEGSPAEAAGLEVGDVIVEVNGEDVEEWRDVLRAGRGSPDKPDEIVWLRGDERMNADVRAEKTILDEQRFLGVEFQVSLQTVKKSVPAAVASGVRKTFATLGEIVVTVKRIITADVGAKNMGGIITISRVSYHAAQQGFGKLLYMTAIISASLAFLNILPIPVLDGGHLVFLVIEKVRGQRLSERTMTILQSVGFAALILLVVFVTWNDILRLVGN